MSSPPPHPPSNNSHNNGDKKKNVTADDRILSLVTSMHLQHLLPFLLDKGRTRSSSRALQSTHLTLSVAQRHPLPLMELPGAMHEVRDLDAGVDTLDFTWATRAFPWVLSRTLEGLQVRYHDPQGGQDGLSVVRCLPEALLDKEESARGVPPFVHLCWRNNITRDPGDVECDDVECLHGMSATQMYLYVVYLACRSAKVRGQPHALRPREFCDSLQRYLQFAATEAGGFLYRDRMPSGRLRTQEEYMRLATAWLEEKQGRRGRRQGKRLPASSSSSSAAVPAEIEGVPPVVQGCMQMLGVAPAPGGPPPRTLQEVAQLKHALTGLPLDVCKQMTESFAAMLRTRSGEEEARPRKRQHVVEEEEEEEEEDGQGSQDLTLSEEEEFCNLLGPPT